MKRKFKKGDKVIVNDIGLTMLYNTMKQIDPDTKPNNQGYVEEIYDDGTILVSFPIGDEDINKHSQVAPYPANQVILKDW